MNSQPATKIRFSNLGLRIITALILGGIALWSTWKGGIWFALFTTIVSGFVLLEWQGLTRRHQNLFSMSIAWVFYIASALLIIFDRSALEIFTTIFIGLILLVFTRSNSVDRNWVVFGLFYAAVPAASLTLLRGDEPFGFGAVIFLFAVVWGTDIAAYFNGKALGGPKLAPRLSPNKTWSGALGGTAIGVAAGTAFVALSMTTTPANWTVPLLALVLSIVSQIGDIGESWVKRHFNVKDSSNFLPGHGGFMDRVDGLVCAATLLYVIGAIFADPNVPAKLFHII